MARKAFVLWWIERVLLTIGLTLAAWCSAVLIDAHYVRNLPIPPPTLIRTSTLLPGDSASESTASNAAGGRRLATGTWIARLEASSVALSATVLEGTDDRTLKHAAGHIEATAFPGEQGNIGIAGHRDTIFRPLRNIKVGDPIVLTTGDDVFEYRVMSTTIVNPEDVYVLDSTPQPTLTLVTCYPFTFIGSAPRRFIVRAELEGTNKRSVR